MDKQITRRFRVYGIVQGVGFRPTVSRHAAECSITGTVCNKGPYVEILAQGPVARVEAFHRRLAHQPPRRAAILKIDAKDVKDAPAYTSFEIVESEKTDGEIYISPDIAICEECRQELYRPSDRRYLHPFINCTNCGPRMTILEALPYDRERTSMREFPLCPACAAEYRNPASRRYDAQPVCCHDCGPEVYMLGGPERGRAAILRARRTLASGGILAVKGIGGFHLCCDAANERAVQTLRQRKGRPVKPFAVMLRDLSAVRRECRTDALGEEILTGHQKPILLLERKENGRVCEAVAPGNPKLGVMLPYAPVQHLLFDYDDGLRVPDALVMTSGNRSGAPICRDDADAVRELGDLCDAILSHNRKIRVRADDSVMEIFEGQPYMVRRSRGYAPLPVLLSGSLRGSVLAVGGELKNAFCVGKNELFYPSPYIGDLEDIRTGEALAETAERFLSMLEVKPELVACDLHPGYRSAQIAEDMGLPLLRVQHHYAHILSCMAENDRTEAVIGVSFDGTGYGTDGTVWGGEIMVCDLRGFSRRGHIVPFLQVGGDVAVREGWRVAISMLWQLTGNEDEVAEIAGRLSLCEEGEARTICRMAERHLQSVLSTSTGRLFDAVSALLGICRRSTFEGEASMALQFAAERWREAELARGRTEEELIRLVREDFRDMPLVNEPDGEPRRLVRGTIDCRGLRLATDELFRALGERVLRGGKPGYLAWAFHVQLAEQTAEFCRLLQRETGIGTAALSGGVFQNLLLLSLLTNRIREIGMEVLTHHLIPPNDGGIGLGQAVAAMAELNRRRSAPGQAGEEAMQDMGTEE